MYLADMPCERFINGCLRDGNGTLHIEQRVALWYSIK